MINTRIIFTATREVDGTHLHLLNRGTEHHSWVVCWNYDEKTKSWDWGSYSSQLSKALEIFLEKYSLYSFNQMNEGLVSFDEK